jgi:hypothetical protein
MTEHTARAAEIAAVLSVEDRKALKRVLGRVLQALEVQSEREFDGPPILLSAGARL